MRNINVDREPITSEDVSSYKDFNNILKKHTETTSDLKKIKAGKSLVWYKTMGGAFIITALAASIFYISNSEDQNVVNTIPLVSEKDVIKSENKNNVQKIVKWEVMFNSTQDPIHKYFDFEAFSSDKIEYIQLTDEESIKTLIKGIKNTGVEFVKGKKVFKIDNNYRLETSADKTLFKLVEGNWLKVDYNPYEFDKLIKPKKLEIGKPVIKIEEFGFGKEFKEFENMIWQPVQPNDLDESFFDHNWPDGSIVETSVSGVYNITLIDGDLIKQFYGYPVLQKYAYKKALKEYNKKLIRQQELMKKALKKFDIQKGVYVIMDE